MRSDSRTIKVYHMIIGKEIAERFDDTSTRKEYLSTTQGYAPKGWICVGVCGYHEKRRKEMYRDLIGEVTEIKVNDIVWYYQQFCKPDGNLKCIRLYDEDGDFVSEFKSMDRLHEFVEGVK